MNTLPIRHRLSPLLALYFARHFLLNLLAFAGILLGIALLFELIELLRRAGDSDDLGLGTLLVLALLKLPQTGQILLPYALLFAALMGFWRLSRRQELVMARDGPTRSGVNARVESGVNLACSCVSGNSTR